jgi:hypothetical protein
MSQADRLTLAGLARVPWERWLASSTAAGLSGLAMMMAPARLSG